MNMKGAEQLGINAKKQKPEKNSKENNAKEKLERDLRSCMKCKYFWGNDNRCINNEKCGAGKQKTEKQQESNVQDVHMEKTADIVFRA